MKNISLNVDFSKCVDRMRTEAANTAARAELMGLTGVFDVMPVMDEEVSMVKEWIDHSLADLQMLMGRKLVGASNDGSELRLSIEVPNNYNDNQTGLFGDRAMEFIVSEMMVHWCRWCEAASTMKGAGSPLGTQWARVRDANWEVLKLTLNARKRAGRNNN